MAIASFILGIVSALMALTIFKDFAIILGVVGLVLGIISIRRGTIDKGMATAGIILTVIAIILAFLTSSSDTQSGSGQTSSGENFLTSNNKTYGFNEEFSFDDLSITILSNYSFDTVRNQFSDYNGKTVVKLPVKVTNNSSETHGLNMFYYNVYGSKGTEAEEVSAYFDNGLDEAGDLRSGASYTKYMYFLYDGNGTYAIEFDNFSEKIEVEFNITR